jgi:TonB family protein
MTRLKKFFILLISFLLTGGANVVAQSGFNYSGLFEGGEAELYNYFNNQPITYPETSVRSGTLGLSVAELVLNSKGKILEVNIINSLDKGIDEQVTELLKSTKNLWKKTDADTTRLYFQFRYRIITERYKQGNYQFIGNDNFVLPIFITSVEYGNDSLNIVPDDTLALRSTHAVRQKNYELAGDCLDEMIQRNPYSMPLYQMRISVNTKMNNKTEVAEDINKLSGFIKGIPMNQLIVGDYKELMPKDTSDNGSRVYVIAKGMPEFPGGDMALYDYLKQNLLYPPQAKIDSVQGSVMVHFVIDEEGHVKDANVLRGIGGGCDEEALRLIQSMPRWKPGLNSLGDPVKIGFNLRVNFYLTTT